MFPSKGLDKAKDEIEEMCNILEHEGVIVRRPAEIDHGKVGFLYFITSFSA